jgi:polyphosphate kinase
VLFPIQDARLRDSVRDDVLKLHLADNVKARLLGSDGRFSRLAAAEQESSIDSQATRLAEPGSWHFEV